MRRALSSVLLAVLAVSTLWVVGAAPASAANTAQNRKFVAAAYQDLLGREPTAAELDSWAAKLAAGTSRSSLAIQLARTPEWAGDVVVELYEHILDRTPDDAGRTFWANQLIAGKRTADLASQLYGSEEFYVRARGTARAFVIESYLRIFDRRPEPGATDAWIAKLDAGYSRTAMARTLYLSIESNGRRVDALYQQLLGRAPDAAGRAFWARRLVAEDDLVLAGRLVGSDEYFRRAQTR